MAAAGWDQLLDPTETSLDKVIRVLNGPTPSGVSNRHFQQWRAALLPDRPLMYDFMASAGLIRTGVKVFYPTLAEYCLLAETPVAASWGTYRQPFSTFVVEIPPGYYTSPVADVDQVPEAVIVHYDQNDSRFIAYVIGVTPDSLGSDKFRFAHRHLYNYCRDPAEMIEPMLRGELASHLPTGEFKVQSGPDADRTREVVRAAMNACLWMINRGRVDRGPVDPVQAARLTAVLTKAHVKPTVRQAATRDLQLLPTLYTFTTDITVDPVNWPPPKSKGPPTGRHNRFLGRRAHEAYRLKWVGGEKRMVKVPVREAHPNPKHFAGDPLDATVAYRTPPPVQ